jgi:hypothetical protein
VTVLKPTATPAPQAEGLQPMTEKKITFLGAIALEPGERVALDISGDMAPETIAAKIEAANAERVEASRRESATLAEMFHLTKAEEPATPKPKPRDWLIP